MRRARNMEVRWSEIFKETRYIIRYFGEVSYYFLIY